MCGLYYTNYWEPIVIVMAKGNACWRLSQTVFPLNLSDLY